MTNPGTADAERSDALRIAITPRIARLVSWVPARTPTLPTLRDARAPERTAAPGRSLVACYTSRPVDPGTSRVRVPWGCSSAGRAPRSHRGGQGFESPHLHHFPWVGWAGGEPKGL